MKLSIVIPVYNVAAYLHACLCSVMDAVQEVKRSGGGDGWRVEIICIDDGSTDESGRILEDAARHSALASSNWTFTVVHQQNRGVGAARNAGLVAATGDWVMFLDGDDILAPDWLEVVSRAVAAAPSADLVKFGEIRFSEAARFPEAKAGGSVRVVDVSDRFRAEDYNVSFFRYAYRREAIGATRFKGYSRGEDQLFLCEVLLRALRIVEIPETLYGYRQRPGSAVHRAWTQKALQDQLDYYRDFMTLLRASSRHVDASVIRDRGKFVSEFAVAAILSLPEAERQVAWRHWFESVGVFRRVGGFSSWVRFVLAACALTGSRSVATLLCYVPHWLKRKGLHR